MRRLDSKIQHLGAIWPIPELDRRPRADFPSVHGAVGSNETVVAVPVPNDNPMFSFWTKQNTCLNKSILIFAWTRVRDMGHTSPPRPKYKLFGPYRGIGVAGGQIFVEIDQT